MDNLNWTAFKRWAASRNVLKIAGLLAVSGLGLLIGLFGYFAKDLPNPNKINAREVEQTTKIFDRKGVLLYQVYGEVKRTLIPFDQMPSNCKNATIVKEDRNFYKHRGFVPRSIVRAFTATVGSFFGVGKVEGGSTITQQLVKNVLLSPEQTITRKIKELILSIEIEQLLQKDDILRVYLNEIPYGSNAYGLEAAANTFFNKKAKNLSLEECAVLAALPQAPTYYSPYGQNKAELLDIKDFIIDEMAKEGYIPKNEAEEAKNREIKFISPREQILAPHFTLWVKQQLVDKYGEAVVEGGGLQVTTTLDYSLFKKAEAAIAADRGMMNQVGASNASVVSIDPKTGQIVVMVGSKDYFNKKIDGNVNIALTLQQPGSSLKPIIYGILWSKPDRWGRTWGPGSVTYDVSTDFGGAPAFRPQNYDGRSHGIVTMRRALANSYNIPAVKTLYMAGVEDTVKDLKELGYSSKTISADRCGLSLVLGGCEVTLLDHASAYATVANLGVRHAPTTILKITKPDGKVLEEWKATKGEKVMDPQTAYLIGDTISDPASRAPTFGPQHFNIGRRAAAKTGTTDDFKDAWTMGFTPQLATGVWVGNNNNKALQRSGTGAMVAEPIWRKFMASAHKNKPVEWLKKPSGIKRVTLDNKTGTAPDGGSSGVHTDIFAEWYKAPKAVNGSRTYITDIVSGGLADLYICGSSTNRAGETRTPGNTQRKIYTGRIQAEIPAHDSAYPRWQAAVAFLGGGSTAKVPKYEDNVHSCNDTGPDVTNITYSGGQITATINLGSSQQSGLYKAFFYVDGSLVATVASCSGGGTLTCTVTAHVSPGSHRFTVTAEDKSRYRDSLEKTIVVN